MSVPNFNPDDHGEEIPATGDFQHTHEAQVLAAMTAELEGSTAAKLAERLVPVVPDGGQIGRALAPKVGKATSIRDTARIWAPGLATTGGFAIGVMVLPMTGPLLVYGLGLVGFGWWTAAGRPGPVESVKLLFFTAADFCRWVKHHITRLAERRAAHEARRTSTDVPKKSA